MIIIIVIIIISFTKQYDNDYPTYKPTLRLLSVSLSFLFIQEIEDKLNVEAKIGIYLYIYIYLYLCVYVLRINENVKAGNMRLIVSFIRQNDGGMSSSL